MALEISWQTLPAYLVVGCSLLLAALLLWLDFQKRANRAFAIVLILRAAPFFFALLRRGASNPAEFEFYQRLLPYFAIAQVPAMLYFLMVYPGRRTWFGRSKWGGWSLLVATLVLEAIYAVDHSMYSTYAAADAGAPTLAIGSGYYYTGFGPLVLLGSLAAPMLSIAALVLAYDYLREKPGSARYSLVLIVAGFLLSALFSGVQLSFLLIEAIGQSGDYPWLPWGWAFAVIPALALPLGLGALALMWVGSQRTKNPQDDREAKRLLIIAPIAMLSAFAFSVGGEVGFGSRELFLLGLWRLALPILIAYGLLRYHLFDLDVKARLTIQHGTVAAAFGLVFFFVSEFAEAFIEERAGNWVGLAAAGFLTFAIKPLERMGQGLAQRVMPGAKPIQELSQRQRVERYQSQFAMALQDGRLTAKERKMLAELQRRLGLDQAPGAGLSAPS